MVARVLRPGEALPLLDLTNTPTSGLVVGLSGSGQQPDLVALLMSASGRVRSDFDLVFYNNPASSDDAVTWVGARGDAEWVRIAVDRLDADVDRVVLGCSGGLLDSSASGELTLTLTGPDGAELAKASFDAEPAFAAMILLEIYRRQGAWRCRLLAQGYAGGLAALVTEFGVEVDQDVAEPPASPSATSVSPTVAESPPVPVPVPTTEQPAVWSQPAPPPPAPPGSTPYPPAPTYGYQQPAATYLPAPPEQWHPAVQQPRHGGLFTSRRRAQLEAQNAELTRLLVETGHLQAGERARLQAQGVEMGRLRLSAAQLEARNTELNQMLISSGAMDNITVEAERRRLAGEVAALTAESERRRTDLANLQRQLTDLRSAIATAEGDAELTEVGIYHYRHRLDDAVAYKAQLDVLRDRIKTTAKAGRAVTGNTAWTVNGSASQGRKMVAEFSKLMLRAYNADADHAVRTMRAYKLDSALARLDTTRATIARLGQTMTIAVTDEFHRLRRAELQLTADYLNKVEEERERQRELREQQREQQRADAEYAREQVRLERDRDKYADALARLETAGETQKAIEIRSQLTSVTAALGQLSYRRSNLRLGWVYVISNVGAFGQRMVKIGMTRRVEPMDRVRELGDASVPFRFDVHALIFSEDAVALETALHQRFAAHKVNRVNQHREFFYVTPAEVRQALAELGSQYLVHYTEDIEAPEWRQSGGPERAVLPT